MPRVTFRGHGAPVCTYAWLLQYLRISAVQLAQQLSGSKSSRTAD